MIVSFGTRSSVTSHLVDTHPGCLAISNCSPESVFYDTTLSSMRHLFPVIRTHYFRKGGPYLEETLYDPSLCAHGERDDAAYSRA